MPHNPANPLIVQGDRTVLVEVDNDRYEKARDQLARFAELVKSPEHIHTYRISPLSLWNAAAAGMTAEHVVGVLERYSKYDVPANVAVDVRDILSRYGRLRLETRDGNLVLVSQDRPLIAEVWHHRKIRPLLLQKLGDDVLIVDPAQRGPIKQALVELGFPAEDLAGYVKGAPLPLGLRTTTRQGHSFRLRHYQREAVDIFAAGGAPRGGSGVVVLPCGAGKTVIGLGAMQRLQTATLILTTSTVAVRQWIAEILDKTTLTPEEVGEYTGARKEIRPVTVTTYQILTHRPRRVDEETGEVGEFPHLALFGERDWGLVIYDEVHLLPAPIFRVTAHIQACRRLGLTATLVREDGRETDVFTLIGPKKYDMPWKDLERQGWIATAQCHEIRLGMDEARRLQYAVAEPREKYRIAAENPAKLDVLLQLVDQHAGDQVLIIGQYLRQIKAVHRTLRVARALDAPLITGQTPVEERERLFEAFRAGEVSPLVVSKVANFAIDLPDANVAIQISGTYGSRQEEAQRLGRILRPKENGLPAHFYSLVTRDSRDQDFAAKRQLFLTEQGYRYTIVDADQMTATVEPR